MTKKVKIKKTEILVTLRRNRTKILSEKFRPIFYSSQNHRIKPFFRTTSIFSSSLPSLVSDSSHTLVFYLLPHCPSAFFGLRPVIFDLRLVIPFFTSGPLADDLEEKKRNSLVSGLNKKKDEKYLSL